MATLRELGWLGARTLTLLWLGRWRLGAWFCLGFALHLVGLEVSAILGAEHDLLATLAFVIGLAAQLLALIAMINSLRPLLRAPSLINDPRPPSLPDGLLRPEPFVAVITAALGPFLAVYAVWGLIDDEARALFTANIAQQGLGGVLQWSISWAPSRLPFYLVLLASAYLLRLLLRSLLRPDRWPRVRLGSRPTTTVAAVGVLVEAVLVYASFAVLIIVGRAVRRWLLTRVVVVGLRNAGRSVLDAVLAALPAIRLPFDLTLPVAVARALDWLWSTGLPLLAHGVLLPLMWLALAAVVFGWREFLGREVLAGLTVPHRVTRAGERLGSARAARSATLRRVAFAATGDLRTKYLPVLQALRLVLGSGPRFLGAYLVLSALVTALGNVIVVLLTLAIGPTSGRVALATDPMVSLVSGLLTQPLAVALYVAAFDRVVGDRVRSEQPEVAVTAAGGRPRPSSTGPAAAPAGRPRPEPGS